ncbi:MAG TPA: metallophosphoesterase, partial [Polyangiaceae bacterium]
MAADTSELLYFWAIGDLHFRDHKEWNLFHAPRMRVMFDDLHDLWRAEGAPEFCVSPGDVIDSGAARNYRFAKNELGAYLGAIPFYPGMGNHEYYPETDETVGHTGEEYCTAWGKPLRYAWKAGNDQRVLCVMLDHVYRESETWTPSETLAFLDATLRQHAGTVALLFTHCPLKDTVLDRDPARDLDGDSRDPFFYVENSDEVRALLGRHPNAVLYFSGHTHSGWGSPGLVSSEVLHGAQGPHCLSNVNLMSPFYT